ncbi:mite allergen Eur m 3-like [Argopecten irradians]|uniref:mite allergen Eur m 3-like n=1 Tax=Argopecten irradians TaxID=31199 RepID=UPI00371A0D21
MSRVVGRKSDSVPLASEIAALIKRIINGKAANIKDFPWQASLRTAISFCGAVVISSKTALTAAHCIKPNVVHALKVGSSFYHGGGGKTFKVTSIITHPEYDSRPTRNDIAILKFNEPIIGKALAKAIAIPEDDSDFSGQSCNITGWGQIKKHGAQLVQRTELSYAIARRAAFMNETGIPLKLMGNSRHRQTV